ncbi:DNA invertase Pin-like site-specific DNA recombinase [Brevibacillus nitrificans]|nr:DNA invertase Pin-like site-specific DNA recombinase [Brevibacillus nitrificans]
MDDKTSAYKKTLDERPEATRLLKEIKEGKIDNLILYKRDRLARNVMEHMEFYYAFKEKNVKVYFTFDSEHPMGFDPIAEYIELIMAGISQHEGQQLKVRVNDTKVTNFESGELIGRLPYGYTTDPMTNEILPVESELTTVKMIFQEVLSRKHEKLNDLRKYLMNKGVERERKNPEWTSQAIEKAVGQPMYMGLRVMSFKGIPYTRSLDELAIIEPDDWEKAQEILEEMKPNRESNSVKMDFPLEGFLRCEMCQENFVGKIRMRKGINVGFYECPNHVANKVEKEKIEKAVLGKANMFLSSLITENYDTLFSRYVISCRKKYQKLVEKHDIKIQHVQDKLHEKVEKWLGKDQIQKEKRQQEIFDLNQELQQLKQEKDSIVAEMNALNNMKTMKQELNELLNHSFPLDEMCEKYGKGFLHDVISTVSVSPFTYKIILKHPFLSFLEVKDIEEDESS